MAKRTGREVPGDTEVWVLDETVATLEEVTSEGSGLDQDQTAERITLLSQKDGSVVAEKDVARHSTSVDRYGVIVFGSQDVFDDEQSALTEDGRTIDHEPQDSDSEGGPVSVGGTPIDPSLKPSTAFLANILAIDRKQGLSVLEVTPLPYGESAPPIYVVDTKTGQVVYELQCPDLLSTGEMIARNSPNGRYGVAGPFGCQRPKESALVEATVRRRSSSVLSMTTALPTARPTKGNWWSSLRVASLKSPTHLCQLGLWTATLLFTSTERRGQAFGSIRQSPLIPSNSLLGSPNT